MRSLDDFEPGGEGCRGLRAVLDGFGLVFNVHGEAARLSLAAYLKAGGI